MTYPSIIDFLVRKKSKDNADTSVTFNLAVMALKSDQLLIIGDLQIREIFEFYTLTRYQTYSSINTHIIVSMETIPPVDQNNVVGLFKQNLAVV